MIIVNHLGGFFSPIWTYTIEKHNKCWVANSSILHQLKLAARNKHKSVESGVN